MQFEEIEIKTAELLAAVYMKVNWMKVAARHNAWDIFQHRVRTAATQQDIEKFLERLCFSFGIQSLSPDYVELLGWLKERNDDVMEILRTKSIPLCMLAIKSAKEQKAKKKKEKDVQKLNFGGKNE